MSNKEKAVLEFLRRVHYDGHFIEVGEYPGNPDYLELRTTDESKGYFGEVSISMTPQFALTLGAALMAAAREKGAQ